MYVTVLDRNDMDLKIIQNLDKEYLNYVSPKLL
jgi:hypothetical protein